MTSKILTLATVVAVGVCLAPAANATWGVSVENICDLAPGGVNTVRVSTLVSATLEYSFQRLPDGNSQIFQAASQAISSRKFVSGLLTAPLAPRVQM